MPEFIPIETDAERRLHAWAREKKAKELLARSLANIQQQEYIPRTPQPTAQQPIVRPAPVPVQQNPPADNPLEAIGRFAEKTGEVIGNIPTPFGLPYAPEHKVSSFSARERSPLRPVAEMAGKALTYNPLAEDKGQAAADIVSGLIPVTPGEAAFFVPPGKAIQGAKAVAGKAAPALKTALKEEAGMARIAKGGAEDAGKAAQVNASTEDVWSTFQNADDVMNFVKKQEGYTRELIASNQNYVKDLSRAERRLKSLEASDPGYAQEMVQSFDETFNAGGVSTVQQAIDYIVKERGRVTTAIGRAGDRLDKLYGDAEAAISKLDATKTPLVNTESLAAKADAQAQVAKGQGEMPVSAPSSELGSIGYITALKNPGGYYQLFFRGTRNEIFPGEKFASASEARNYWKAQKIKADALPKEAPNVATADPTKRIVDELESIEHVKQAIKKRAMGYQSDLKDEVARANGVPPGTYEDLPYAQWEKVRSEYLNRAPHTQEVPRVTTPPRPSPMVDTRPLEAAPPVTSPVAAGRPQGAPVAGAGVPPKPGIPSRTPPPAASSVAESSPAAPPPGTPPIVPEPKRVPLYAQKAAQEKAAQLQAEAAGAGKPPVKPPKPFVGTPGETPSGRRPGGPQNMKRLGNEADPLAQVEAALTPQKDSFATKAGDALSASRWIDSNHILQDLEASTGVQTHKLAQVVNGAWGAGEDVSRLTMEPAIKSLPQRDVANLQTYMVLKRAEDIKGRAPGALLPGNLKYPTDGLAALEKKVGPERFQAIAQSADQLWAANNKEVLRYYQEHGILSAEQVRDISAANPHYISYGREDFHDTLGKSLSTGGKQVANVSSNTLQALDLAGSTRKLHEPLNTFLAGPIKAHMVVARNDAAKGIVAALKASQTATGEELVRQIDASGQLARNVNISGMAKPALKKTAEHSGVWDTISYFENGKQLTFEVPAEYAQLAKGLDAETTGLMGKWATAINLPIRAGAVTFNLAFLPRNMARDIQSIWQIEGKDAFPHYFSGLKSAILKDKAFSDAAQAGAFMSGITENMAGRTPLEIAQRLGGIKPRTPGDALLFLPRLIESSNMAIERGGRIAVFKAAKAQGATELEAAIRARNVTVDFSKSGTSMKVLNQIVPFSNASLQGTVNMVGAIKRNPVKSLGIAATPFLTATVLTRVNNMRYSTADQIPDYEYARYWPVIVGEGTKNDGTKFPIYVKMPKGTFAGAVTAPADALFTYASKTNDKTAVNLIFDAAMAQVENASPVTPGIGGILPGPIQTGVAITTNKNLYSGADVVPGRRQNLLPQQQFDEKTMTLAVALGQQFGISPDKIDFALKNTAAGVGEQSSWLAGLGLEAIGYKRPTPYGAALDQGQQAGTEQALNTPLIRPFVGTRNTQQERQGYEHLNKVTDSTNREFALLPGMNDLGIRLGQVGDSIDMVPGAKGGSVTLTAEERAAYQQIVADTVITGLRKYATESVLSKKTPNEKKAYIQSVMGKLKDQASAIFKQQYQAKKTSSFPVPVPTAQPAQRPAVPPTASGWGFKVVGTPRPSAPALIPVETR